MRNGNGRTTFISALLYATARALTDTEKATIIKLAQPFAGVLCDDNFCSLYVPLSSMGEGCKQVRRLHDLLALDYECDPEDVIVSDLRVRGNGS